MVLYAQPIADCLRAVQREVAQQGRPAPHIVFLTAGGQRYTEEHAKRLAQYDNLTLVCGHYAGAALLAAPCVDLCVVAT